MKRLRKYKLKGSALQMTQKLGAQGGAKNSEAQKAARRRNIYLALAVRFPNSVLVKAKLKQIEREAQR